MQKVLLTFVALIVLAACGVQAQESGDVTTEKWRCFGLLDFSQETVAVRLSRIAGEDHGFGEVSVAGITHRAGFQVAGFNRRWDFGIELNYAFIIEPDGSGAYYDFSNVEDGGMAGSSQRFNCVSP